MRGIRAFFCLTALLLVAAPQAFAQETRTVGTDELDAAVAERAAAEDRERERLRAVLERDEVREVAERHGIDLERIQRGAGTLGGGDLSRVAPHVSAVEAALQEGIRISTTAILLILLLIVVIILIT